MKRKSDSYKDKLSWFYLLDSTKIGDSSYNSGVTRKCDICGNVITERYTTFIRSARNLWIEQHYACGQTDVEVNEVIKPSLIAQWIEGRL